MDREVKHLKLLVTGSRDFEAKGLIWGTLNDLWDLNPDMELVHGGAVGADTLAGDWARAMEVPVQAYPARWNTHSRDGGKIQCSCPHSAKTCVLAGVRRNQEMLDRAAPDAVLAFFSSPQRSHGTADIVTRAGMQSVPYAEVIVGGFLTDFSSLPYPWSEL